MPVGPWTQWRINRGFSPESTSLYLETGWQEELCCKLTVAKIEMLISCRGKSESGPKDVFMLDFIVPLKSSRKRKQVRRSVSLWVEVSEQWPCHWRKLGANRMTLPLIAIIKCMTPCDTIMKSKYPIHVVPFLWKEISHFFGGPGARTLTWMDCLFIFYNLKSLSVTDPCMGIWCLLFPFPLVTN